MQLLTLPPSISRVPRVTATPPPFGWPVSEVAVQPEMLTSRSVTPPE